MRACAAWAFIAGVALIFYALGLTAGYGGCVAQAGAIFTNNILRGM